jgi:hypothetical protein
MTYLAPIITSSVSHDRGALGVESLDVLKAELAVRSVVVGDVLAVVDFEGVAMHAWRVDDHRLVGEVWKQREISYWTGDGWDALSE